MSNPYQPPESGLPERPPRQLPANLRGLRFGRWIRAVCVFLVVTPTAIATILFFLGLVFGLPTLAVTDGASMGWMSSIGIIVSVAGGTYTGIKAAWETLPLDDMESN